MVVTLDTPAGSVTVLSRTHRLSSLDLDGSATSESGQANGLVTDEHGRPLELLYGLVCRVGGIWEMSEEDFNAALNQALQAYRRFLADEDRPFEESRAFRLRTRASHVTTPSATSPPASDEHPRRSPPQDPPLVRGPREMVSGVEPRPRRLMTVKTVTVVGVAAAVAFLAVIGLGGEGPVIKVAAEVEPPDAEVDCSQPVPITVHVHITTNDGATVSWIAGNERRKLARQTDLTFDKAGTANIDLPVLDLGSGLNSNGSAVIKRSYKVITNQPNKLEGNAEYSLRCRSVSR